MPKLVAIGDSLTQGVQSGSVFKTGLSFPALIAESMGSNVPKNFRVPSFPGSGLPFNIECFLRSMRQKLGRDIEGIEWAELLYHLSGFVDDIEDLYERGAGSKPAAYTGLYHNLAVAGFRVYDSFKVNAKYCVCQIMDKEGWIQDDFLGLPSAPMYRIAQRVLNPGQRRYQNSWTQIDNLKALNKPEDPVENLILFLGANDCLGTLKDLEIRDMAENPPSDPQERRKRYNLTSAEVFREDYRRMVVQISSVISDTTRVFVGNVPHVTIAPITQGISGDDDSVNNDGYFPYYGPFYATQEAFNPRWDPHLTGTEAQRIDKRIDEFNAIIGELIQEQGERWQVVDICALLDDLAVKRNSETDCPTEVLENFFQRRNRSDHPLLAANLNPTPSVLRFESSQRGRISGGLFSLDCFHPTTIGYGLIAEEFLREMENVNVENADPTRLNWRQIIKRDSLIQNPPALWDDILEVADAHPRLTSLIYRILESVT
ncbi:lipase [Candidatus Poribacteria bacterium]|nr:lipase [Candidatus Poribacteria bacterium]